MRRSTWLTAALLGGLVGLAETGTGQLTFDLKRPLADLEPTTVTLNLVKPRVTDVLAEITRQTGNPIPRSKQIKNPTLPDFRAVGTFWQVMDKLCAASGNVLRWSDRKG